ncbi:TlpA family protein disulfide reductase [Microbulbifer rhizosphaerae]|uniref:Peroxiredoxin n=1 Tax=Microbulbifer rhizosphaerae TaxID=1562603 RepID=A0A7W4WE35_9GAMM|nr:redoxin domain-containing protein [Microbulbifer rhizosphaerae]MBB3062529.1 peroxiredoxin [Microbulbifer rhizosphaerae]
MKKFVTPALFWLFLLPGSSIAEPVADFSVKLIDGGEFSLHRGAKGKPLLLKFWATWCRACLKQMPDYRKLYKQYGKRVQFLAVNVAVNDSPEQVSAAVREHELTMPVAYDETGELWSRFNVMGTPMYLLLNAEGEIVFSGYRHDERLKQALEKLPTAEQSAAPEPPPVLTDLDGNTLQLVAGPGEILVAYHFATWCESYLTDTDAERAKACAEFRQGINRLGQIPGVRLIGFATRYSSDTESLQRYRQQYRIDHSLVFDRAGIFARHFAVRNFPHLVVLRHGAAPRHWQRIDENLLQQLQP